MKGRIVICDYCGTPADFVDSSVFTTATASA